MRRAYPARPYRLGSRGKRHRPSYPRRGGARPPCLKTLMEIGLQREKDSMSKKESPSNSYVPNRESTAGRDNDRENTQFRELDEKYRSDKAREGTNAGSTSFGKSGNDDGPERY